MPHPAALIARMNRNIATRRPHSRPLRSAPIRRMRDPVITPPFIRGLKFADVPAQATGLVPIQGLHRCGTVPDSYRASLDWPSPGATPRAEGTLAVGVVTVKNDQ